MSSPSMSQIDMFENYSIGEECLKSYNSVQIISIR